MYLPSSFQVTDAQSVAAFLREHPFATLISSTPDGPFASHLPLEFSNEEGERAGKGVLLGHVARANAHWRHFDGSAPSLAIFHGPHAYISPAWYESDSLPPTWNYAVVHAYGHPKVLEDPVRVREVLDVLVERFESERSERWLNTLDPEFVDKLQAGIVAFEFPIDEIEAKFKLGQNRSPADQAASLEGLASESGSAPGSLASFWRAILEAQKQ